MQSREAALRQPRSPTSIIWHDSWQQEQLTWLGVHNIHAYMHALRCAGWLFHNPVLFVRSESGCTCAQIQKGITLYVGPLAAVTVTS